jgi:hypothetical protein
MPLLLWRTCSRVTNTPKKVGKRPLVDGGVLDQILCVHRKLTVVTGLVTCVLPWSLCVSEAMGRTASSAFVYSIVLFDLLWDVREGSTSDVNVC